MCSFGDAVAVSDEVDITLASILKQEVSDLIIAPSYSKEALSVLKKKKKGGFLVIQIDEHYEPSVVETREFYGMNFQQQRNTAVIDKNLFTNCVTVNKSMDKETMQSMILATIGLKYTQSNSVIVAFDSQLIGVGAGQQSRVHCLRLACNKADKWFLQQHPAILNLKFKEDLLKPEKSNIVDQLLLWDELTDAEKIQLSSYLKDEAHPVSTKEKTAFIQQFQGICLSSDAFFPFRDNIDRASRSNIGYIAHPGGSVRDSDCIQAANEYRMVMFHTGLRLFTH
jgi:AICAR transformylase/IMP cyclohydrolase PurH